MMSLGVFMCILIKDLASCRVDQHMKVYCLTLDLQDVIDFINATSVDQPQPAHSVIIYF
jgi:hypothetical protein